jgi:hypothetical protein
MSDALRRKLYRLTNLLSLLLDRSGEDEVEKAWQVMQSLYYDLYMLNQIYAAEETVEPGDMMTYEEALQWLERDRLG